MNAHLNWLPRDRVLLLAMAKIWAALLDEFGAAWDVAAAWITAFLEVLARFTTLVAKVQDTALRTHTDIVNCDAVQAELGTMMTELKNTKLRMPPLTLTQWTGMLLPAYKTTRDEVNASQDIVQIRFVHKGAGKLTAIFSRDPESPFLDSRANKTVKFLYKIVPPGGTIPVNASEMNKGGQTNRDRAALSMGAENSGSTAYFCACYLSGSGKQGDWGRIYSVVIA
jgi:hypothetical protein